MSDLATGAVRFSSDVVRELAIAEHVCVRPLIRRVFDRDTDTETRVALACGSTREAVCPPCSQKARVLRMQQCAEGWHRTDEPPAPLPADLGNDDQVADVDEPGENGEGDRRVRSTRRRDDAPDLPRVPAEDRTVGRVYSTPAGREYRPSMFLTLTLPSYGPVRDGVPALPGSYDYRRAALDALHFAKLVDRFWQNLRRCAGYKVQYFAAVEPQRRLAPHLHAAIRGAIPRELLRQVVRATYVQVWWPPCDQPVYTNVQPLWDGSDYVDPDTGTVLPTWAESVDALTVDPDARPVHVMRFGTQLDMRGIIAPSPDADRAVRYLTKYLTKSVADAFNGGDSDGQEEAYERHVDRLHAEVRWLPCSPGCANWLRYGIQPDHPGPGLQPGRCPSKAHDREHLGLGGRRVLVSRQWSGKTLKRHRADRADVVREALHAAGILAPEIERMAADITSADGHPRFVWTDTQPDPHTYAAVLLASIAERHRWRAQYDAAKTAAAAARASVDGHSATDQPP